MSSNVAKCRAVATVNRLGSFTAAAEELGCTQSTVSRMVSTFEDELGVRLFDRKGGSLTLTVEGARVISDIEQVCRAHERLLSKVSDIKNLDAGRLSIAAPASVLSRHLAEPLGRLSTDHPGVEVDILETTYEEGERLIRKGLVDFAFIPTRVDDDELVSTFFSRDELVVIAQSGHFAGREGDIAATDLIDEPFIADTETAPLLQDRLRGSRIRLRASEVSTIVAFVREGLGVSLIPSLALGGEEEGLDVRHLKNRPFRNMYLVRRKGQALSHVATVFLDYLSLPERG